MILSLLKVEDILKLKKLSKLIMGFKSRQYTPWFAAMYYVIGTVALAAGIALFTTDAALAGIFPCVIGVLFYILGLVK